MNAASAVAEIVNAVFYLQQVYEMSQKIHEEVADMLGRLMAIAPHIVSIQIDLERGRFKDPGQLEPLLRLKDTVQAAEKLVSKLSGTKRGGVVAWAKGAWKVKSNMQQLQEAATSIDRAVIDLTLSDVKLGFMHQVGHTLQGLGQASAQTSRPLPQCQGHAV